jgi:hypothetical protein
MSSPCASDHHDASIHHMLNLTDMAEVLADPATQARRGSGGVPAQY